MQSGSARSPDRELKRETFALLFGFLHTKGGGGVQNEMLGSAASTVSLVPLMSTGEKHRRPVWLVDDYDRVSVNTSSFTTFWD